MLYTDKKNPEKTTEKKRLGIWIVVCMCIFVYLVVILCTYLFGNSTEIYEVVKEKIDSSQNFQYTALALRKENVINTENSGYINFFVGDGLPVTVGENIYVLDSSGELANQLGSSTENSTVLNENDLSKLKNTIFDFDVSFDENEYYDAYYFKYKLSSQITDLIYSSNFNLKNSDILNGNSDLYLAQSPYAGIVQHSYDGYENVDVDDVEAASFRKENYNKTIIKSNDYIESGQIAYKVVTSENWELVFQITNSDIVDELDEVTFEFVSDGIEATGDFETFMRAGNKYGVITLDKYMIRYISDRFIQIRLINESAEGLKIPKSAVGEEKFYIIPIEFMTEGGNSSEYGFIKKDGSDSVQFITPLIIKCDDNNCYVSQESLKKGDIIVQPETNAVYKISDANSIDLPCAYVYEGGTVSCRLVEKVDEISGYYIIKEDTEYGLREYDQILREAISGN